MACRCATLGSVFAHRHFVRRSAATYCPGIFSRLGACLVRATAKPAKNVVNMAGATLDEYLAEMDATRKHQTLLRFAQYPRTKKLEGDKPVEQCDFTCDDEKGAWNCDFSKCMKRVKESQELRAYGAQQLLQTLVDDIKANQDDWMASKLDGFQFYRGGFDLLRMHRLDGNGKPLVGGRTCFLEYNDLRDDALRAHEKAKAQMVDQVLRQLPSDPAAYMPYIKGAGIGAAGVLDLTGFGWLWKKWK